MTDNIRIQHCKRAMRSRSTTSCSPTRQLHCIHCASLKAKSLIFGVIASTTFILATSAISAAEEYSPSNPTIVKDDFLSQPSNSQLKTVRVGVIVTRGEEQTRQKWQPTLDYLSQNIPGYSFELVYLTFDNIEELIAEQKVDFVLVNPGMYVELEWVHGVKRIATLENLRLGKPYTEFGVVIFRRKDRTDIQALEDLKGKKFLAVNEIAFGGWQIAWHTLVENGVKPYIHLKELQFGNSHDAVVYGVRDGAADAGTVPTNTLELMAQEGKINLDEFAILNSQTQDAQNFPFALSTELYPEWPFATMPDTDPELAEQVAIALITMAPDTPAAIAGKYQGWTIPANYQPVHDTLRSLQVRPYENWGKLTWKEAIYQYRYWLGFSGLVVVSLIYRLIQDLYNQRMLLQTQEELKTSQQLLQLVINTLPQSIFWKDRNSVFLGCNQSLAKEAGLDSPSQIIGKTDYDLPWKKEESDHYRECDRRIMDSNTPELAIVESQLQADGKEAWLETSKVPLHDIKGNVIGILGIYQDITLRKKAEITLKQSKAQLEQRVQARTEELYKAKKAAEVASQAKSEFLSSMSHELRTPLNGILGYAQILQRDRSLTSEQKKNLQIIYESGNHLLTLINDILDLSKIEARKLELYPTDIHLESFLSGVEGIIKMRAIAKNINLKFQLITPLPIGILADEKRLRQILLNLLGNAVKFTDCGQVILKVTADVNRVATQQSDDSRFLNFQTFRFEVIDTGIGIDPQKLDKIFLAFEQVGAKKYREEGTGLGLAISKQLVELMGGQLQVKSQLGQGSTFWFEITVPVIKTAKFTNLIEAQKEQIVGYQGQRKQLLIVDDKAENRLVLKNMLEPLGFVIALAEDGQQAINLAQKIRPDCILTDLVMPIKNGFETIKEIRNLPSIKNTVILAISASVFDLNHHNSQLLGYDFFLPKPVDETALLATLQKYLQLSWIYETTTEDSVNLQLTTQVESLPSLVVPPKEEIEILYKLAMLGSMKKIRERAIYLENLDPKYASLAIKLQELADGFQEKAIINLVEQYLN